MKLEQLKMPATNPLYADYVANEETITSFFEYRYGEDAFKKRANYLQSNTYQSEKLAQVIKSYMEPFGLSPEIETNLAHLHNGALVVVGGQQAGILTGPLYSVHKAITVLLVAKEQSEKLNTPVVPVFWIAGEDHDIEEINHTYTVSEGQLKKRAYSKRSKQKWMASNTVFDKEEMRKTVRQIIADYGETAYSVNLLTSIENAVEACETFTDFFTMLMNDLFKQHGLLMVDAAYGPLRSLETGYFEKLIEHSQEISRVVARQEDNLVEKGYARPVQANEHGVNLFYVKDGERHLLEWEHDVAVNKAVNLKFTKEELLEIAKQHPEKLSNNVITRPMMQEMVFPVLSFVGGPGELAYWAILKKGFDVLGLQMPIFTPRLHITMVTPKVQSLLNQLNITVEDVLSGQSQFELNRFLESIQDRDATLMLETLQQMIDEKYERLQSHLETQSIHMNPIIQKNMDFHKNQLNFLKKKITEQVQLKHAVQINRYETVHQEIFPLNGYQERSYSPYKYINEFGPSFIDQLIETKQSITSDHIIFYL